MSFTKPELSEHENIKLRFETDEIVGDILDFAPLTKLNVNFRGIELSPGQELNPKETQHQPSIEWPTSTGHATLHTLLFLDLDALSRVNPEYRCVVHGMCTNIPGNDQGKGDTIIEYFGCSPGKGTGRHRYAFLLFQQQGGRIEVNSLKFTEYMGKDYVFNFVLKKFAEEYKLRMPPTAGNYFQAQAPDM